MRQRCNSYTPIARNIFNRAAAADELGIFNARGDGVMRPSACGGTTGAPWARTDLF